MFADACKLPKQFYLRSDVVQISRELLGKVLVTNVRGKQSAGLIVETEAYAGIRDRASHAWHGRRTDRTDVMFAQGGRAYVYLIYGIHVLFNVTTNKEGLPDAVLIRAIEPLEGIDEMLVRRNMQSPSPALSNGPSKLTQALGIDLSFYGLSLNGNTIWIEDRGISIPEQKIGADTRIRIAYAGEDALRPWRFRIKGNPFVSKK